MTNALRDCLERYGSSSDRVLGIKRGESAEHTTNERKLDERLGCLGQQVIFSVETTLEGQPGEAALHDPAFFDDDKLPLAPEGLDLFRREFLTLWEPIPTGIGVGPLHDFHAVAGSRLDPRFPRPLVAAIGEEMELPLRLLLAQLREELLAAFTIRDVRREHLDTQQPPLSVGDQVMLATVDLLPTVVASDPPFCEVLTLLESTMPAVGTALRPSACLILPRSASFTRSHRPLSFHCRK